MPQLQFSTAFYSEYRHSVDEKGRVSIPADFRPLLLGERGSFFLNRGVEPCITAYPEGKWARVVEQVNAVALDNTTTRWFKRLFFSGAKEVSCDSQGRILIPPALMKYAGITKEVVIVGVSDYVEIWDAETWDGSSKQAMDGYEKRTEEMSQPSSTPRKPAGDTTGGMREQ